MWPFKSKQQNITQPSGPYVERRRVVMRSKDGSHTATDYVPLEYVAAYVRDAATRWGTVSVGSVHDSGPGGDYGPIGDLSHLDPIREQIAREKAELQ